MNIAKLEQYCDNIVNDLTSAKEQFGTATGIQYFNSALGEISELKNHADSYQDFILSPYVSLFSGYRISKNDILTLHQSNGFVSVKMIHSTVLIESSKLGLNIEQIANLFVIDPSANTELLTSDVWRRANTLITMLKHHQYGKKDSYNSISNAIELMIETKDFVLEFNKRNGLLVPILVNAEQLPAFINHKLISAIVPKPYDSIFPQNDSVIKVDFHMRNHEKEPLTFITRNEDFTKFIESFDSKQAVTN